MNFNDKEKNDFLEDAKVAYKTIIINFANGNLKNIESLLDKKVFYIFNDAIEYRKNKGYMPNTTFIGINSASIKEYQINNSILEVTVDFVSEIISCIKDKDAKILFGDPQKIKKKYDTWKFSKDLNSKNLNLLLIDTQA